MSTYGGFSGHRADDRSRASRSTRFAWRYLDSDDAARLWDEVTDWVWWLRDRYELTDRVPRCWYRHGPVVEEFTALMAAWTEAYSSGRGMSAWHSSDLWPLMDRLESISGFEQCQADGCSHDSGFLHAPEGTEAVMEPAHDTSNLDSSTFDDATRDAPDMSDVGAMVVGVVTEDVMLMAVVNGEATALDAGRPHGRYRLGGNLWTWSSILGGYVPCRESSAGLRAIES